MRSDRKDQSMLAIASRWRIEAGFFFAAFVVVFAQPTPTSIMRWVPLALVALALRCWARGYLERRTQLTQHGPYALVRHPLYVGSFLLGLAFALMTNVSIVPFLFAVAFVSTYVPKALREEHFLQQRYGPEYSRYAARVGAVVPRFSVAAASDPLVGTERFAWRRVVRHREYLTWIGATSVLGVMCLRATWLPTANIGDVLPFLSSVMR